MNSPGSFKCQCSVDTCPCEVEADCQSGYCGVNGKCDATPLCWYEAFDGKMSAKWKAFGSAAVNAGGWMELTPNQNSTIGQVYDTVDKLVAGDVTIGFKFMTGGGTIPAADGLALSVVNAGSEAALTTLIGKMGPGACLGYGFSGVCGTDTIGALPVEVDTYPNYDLGEPAGAEVHVGVTKNGDPSAHLLLKTVTGVTGMQWHKVIVTITGDFMTPSLDGAVVSQGNLAAPGFEGGYVGLWASTGAANAYRRVRNVQLSIQTCK